MYDDCPALVRQFLHYLQIIKGRSFTTVNAYSVDLRVFFRFIITHKKLNINMTALDLIVIKQITLADIYEFLHYVSTACENSAKTRARKVSSIRMFFKYLTINLKLITINPAENLETPSIPKSLPKFLTLENCLDLLQVVDGTYKQRDFCILVFFLNCGMRLRELCGINLIDIREDCLLIRGKGNKERMLYLNKACQDALASYLIQRTSMLKNQNQNALFISSRCTRLSGRQVERIVEKHLMKSGLHGLGYSPHKLRHTAATMLYQHGGIDVRVLQEVLGHSNLGTTQIYAHVSNKQLKQAIHQHPLAQFESSEKKSKK